MGTKSRTLCELATDSSSRCEKRSITIEAIYIPGKANVIANEVSHDSGSDRLPIGPERLFEDQPSHPTSSGGSFCRSVECPTGAFYQLEDSPRHLANQRLQRELGKTRRVRFSPVQPDNQMFIEDSSGESASSLDCASLAVPVLVPGVVAAGSGRPINIAADPEPVRVQSRPEPPVAAEWRSVASCLAVIGDRYRKRGLSEGVVNLLLGAIRGSTAATYQSAWIHWCRWNLERNTDPLPPSLNSILECLFALHSSKNAFNSINVARYMLSSSLERIDGFKVGAHPLLSSLMRGLRDCVWIRRT